MRVDGLARAFAVAVESEPPAAGKVTPESPDADVARGQGIAVMPPPEAAAAGRTGEDKRVLVLAVPLALTAVTAKDVSA